MTLRLPDLHEHVMASSLTRTTSFHQVEWSFVVHFLCIFDYEQTNIQINRQGQKHNLLGESHNNKPIRVKWD